MSAVVKLFATPCLAVTLSLFLTSSESELYQFDIVKKSGYALIQVQRALKTLEDIGLISSKKQGRMKYYKAVDSYPGFNDLKKFYFKTMSLGANIRDVLAACQGTIKWAFVFGSFAKGDESADSDVDLFIVGNLGLKELAKHLSPLAKEQQREINPVLLSEEEFLKRVSQSDYFVTEVISSDKIWVLGEEDEFKNLVARRQTKKPQKFQR